MLPTCLDFIKSFLFLKILVVFIKNIITLKLYTTNICIKYTKKIYMLFYAMYIFVDKNKRIT